MGCLQMNFNDKNMFVSEKVEQLKRYRNQIMVYNANKEMFENPLNSIKLDGKVAFISPLNDIEKHLEKNSKILLYNSKGFTALKYIAYGLIISVLIIIGIVFAYFVRGV